MLKLLVNKLNETYREMTKHAPFDADAYYNLGLQYVEQKKYRAAEICFRKALWFTPHDKQVLNNLGCVYLQQQKNSAAKKCFSQALMINPDFKEARANLNKLNKIDDIIHKIETEE